MILSYSWPGNVRELFSTLRRVCILSDSNLIEETDFNFSDSSLDSLSELKEWNLKIVKEKLIQTHVNNAIKFCQGNKSQAGKLLGISERTLFRMLSDDKSGSETDKAVIAKSLSNRNHERNIGTLDA